MWDYPKIMTENIDENNNIIMITAKITSLCVLLEIVVSDTICDGNIEMLG